MKLKTCKISPKPCQQGEYSNYSAKFIIAAIVLLFSLSNAIAQQQVTVQGNVTDMEGNKVPGVTILAKGTTTGALTDQNGHYSIVMPPNSRVLIFSFIGMETQEVNVGNQTIINVTLADATTALEEVVVVGYGTMKKADLTGSVTRIESQALTDVPVYNTEIGRAHV